MSDKQNNLKEVTSSEIIQEQSSDKNELSQKTKEKADNSIGCFIGFFERIGQKSDVVVQGKKSSTMLIKQIESGKLEPDERNRYVENNTSIIHDMTATTIAQYGTIVLVSAIFASAGVAVYGLTLHYKYKH